MRSPAARPCHAMFLCLLSWSALAEEEPRPPEFVADEKADKLYNYYLDAMMETPSFYGDSLTFRIANDIWTGGDGKTPEFYLYAQIRVKWVEIKYPETTSIHASIYQYFLGNPGVTLDRLNYWPPMVHKRITFEQCPELEAPLLAAEEYVRTSLVKHGTGKRRNLLYRVGYTKDHYELSWQVSTDEVRPVTDFLTIRDLALKCAQDLPTQKEVEAAEQLAREHEQAEFLSNFTGPLLYSPPPIVLKHGDRSYESAIGTSCWSIGNEGMCDDVFGSVTPSTPIVVRRGDRLHLEIPLRDRLESMEFAITRVGPGDIRKREEDKEFPQIIVWEKEYGTRPMSERQLQSITIDKPPGNYLLALYGVWADYGDAAHGYYLKVVP